MVKIGEGIEVRDELIKKTCNLTMEAHNLSPGKPYIYKKINGSTDVVFAFAGTLSSDGWYSNTSFGEKEINTTLFPSLRSVGTDEVAKVNEVFATRFEEILDKSSLKNEVEKAMLEGRQVVFAGHSSGGAIAILAALWCLECCRTRPNGDMLLHPYCMTFGSPLVGNKIWSHALRRENWARYFLHFVMKYDVVPRMMLAPLSSIQELLQVISPFINPKSQYYQHEAVARSSHASNFFMTVMRSASSVASYDACNLKGCTNLLLETVSNIVQLSPYRPFGTYIFCTGNRKLVVVENPDAVLQLLFYSSQLSSEAEAAVVVPRSLNDHLSYKNEMQDSLEMQDVLHLNNLTDIPLSSNVDPSMNSALNDLGLSTRARLCLRAAGEWEKQKKKNEEKIEQNKRSIRDALSKIQEYQTKCDIRKVGYYDAFKIQNTDDDFNANVRRLELAGIWDEIIEMLKRYELPDSFEGRRDWIELGTQFRRQVEPLDIANYYRHLKNEDTGPYLIRARPKRYRFTQRWLEHFDRVQAGARSESCFWAEVEELRNKPFAQVQDRVLSLETAANGWIQSSLLGDDIFFPESTYTKWWKTLPPQHKQASWVSRKITP